MEKNKKIKMDEIREDNNISDDDSKSDKNCSLKDNKEKDKLKFNYKEFIISLYESNDNIKIQCIPNLYKYEKYEYIMCKKEFQNIFYKNENISSLSLNACFSKIKKLLIEKKISINYDKNLYNLSFIISLENENERILKFNKKLDNDISKTKFKNYTNLKFNETIFTSNCGGGCNSLFDVFLCYKDSKQYLATSNYINYNIEIIYLENNQLIKSLKGHNNEIFSIRYFINDISKEEYLISSDANKTVIVWNILKDYKIDFLSIINYSYYRNIYSCILSNIDEFNYVIISSYTTEKKLDEENNNDYTKMYSLMNGGFIKNIYNTNNNCTRYLLSWHNDEIYSDYIIECCDRKISINNLLKKENYFDYQSEIKGEEYLSGFVFSKNGKDYLCTGSWNGFIRIFDLFEKIEIKNTQTEYCEMYHMIMWSNKFLIVANKFIRAINIINIDSLEIVTAIRNNNLEGIKCIKKIIHPKFGESLLTCSENGTINLYILYDKI